nr:zinc ribbon domain-containing protein [Armatimonas sp.]
MRYCSTCKFMSPRDALYCGHCARSFGGRRCPHHHLSPPDAKVCVQCGSPELTEAAGFLSVTGALRTVLLLAGGILAVVALPSLLHALSQGASSAWHGIFNVVVLDRVLAFVFVSALLLHLLPGEIGKVVRRNIARLLDMLLKGALYFLAGIPHLLAALIQGNRRRR